MRSLRSVIPHAVLGSHATVDQSFQRHASLSIMGIKIQRGLEVQTGLIRAPLGRQGKPEVGMRRWGKWLQAHGLGELRNRLVHFSLPRESVAKIVMGICVVGLHAQGFSVMCSSLV